MKLTITLQVKDRLEAYKIVSKLGFEHKVAEAVFDNQKWSFNNNTKHFLKEHKFPKNKLIKIK